MPKKNTLFLDCNSGISGDMFVAALIDLGADVKSLIESLNSLGLDGVTPEIRKVDKKGMRNFVIYLTFIIMFSIICGCLINYMQHL